MSFKPNSSGEANLRAYEVGSRVKKYAKQSELFPAERELIKRLKTQLPFMHMLDIGIGGGRTTASFSPMVKEYVGIDYSVAMVDACIERFSPLPPHVSLACADVRDLSRFQPAQFDLILFSYNGLDCIQHQERLAALKAIRGILKPGGIFCFSTHNLSSFGLNIFDPTLSFAYQARRYLIWILLRILNGNLTALRKKNYAIVRDDGDKFQLKHYYVTPAEQVKQLLNAGFMSPQIFKRTGEEIFSIKNQEMQAESWLYFLTKIP